MPNQKGFEYFQTNYGANNDGRLMYVLTTNHNNTAYAITYQESQKDKIFKKGKIKLV